MIPEEPCEYKGLCYHAPVKPFGLAVLGCGWIARRHASAARALGGAIALSFASRDPARAEAYRAEFGGVAAYGSYEAAVAAPAVDGVLICTPHDQHLAAALLAASHGKHVLVEKPIAWVRSRRRNRVRFFSHRDWRGYRAMLAEFVGAVTAARAHEMDGTEGRRDLAVVLAAYRSIETGQPVDVEW